MGSELVPSVGPPPPRSSSDESAHGPYVARAMIQPIRTAAPNIASVARTPAAIAQNAFRRVATQIRRDTATAVAATPRTPISIQTGAIGYQRSRRQSSRSNSIRSSSDSRNAARDVWRAGRVMTGPG
jgi:hypothetical protein